jgi:predicted nucleic acid-binding protein
MAHRIMVDTNILLYAYDRAEPVRQPRALAVLDVLVKRRMGVLTPQVLAEFYVNAMHKLEPPLTGEEAYERIQSYMLSWEIIELTGPIVLEAARGARIHKMAYWDAQIWASARLHQVPVIFCEDFSGGAVIEGVRFINPVADDFDLEGSLSLI